MTLKPTIIIPILLLALCSASFPAEDVHDYVLKAYRISPAQEAQFARDGQMSPFWAEWDSANKGGTVAMDYIHMTPANNGWVDGVNQFTDSLDAMLDMRAAYGQNALYLLFEITDNVWPSMGYDNNLNILFDTRSSQYIMNADPQTEYIKPSWGWSLTRHTVQYQTIVGSAGAALPSFIQINYFADSMMMYNRINLTNLPTDFPGWDIDMDAVGPNKRRMEWKVPWSWVGCEGGFTNPPLIGTNIAMSSGYDDNDSPTQTGRKSLSWKERSPFNTCNDYPTPHQYCDAWGDILITDQNVGVQSNPSHATPRSLSVSHPIKKQLTRNNTISPCIVSDKNGMRSYWDLAGRRWNAKR